MKTTKSTIATFIAATAFTAGNVNAEIEYKIHTGYTNQYIFRGKDTGNDLTEVGTDMTAKFKGFDLNAGFWYGSFTEGNVNYDELDLYAGVSKDFGFLTASMGYIYYQNLWSTGNDSQEFYFGASRDLGFTVASFTYYWDVETDNDGYSELALAKSFELSTCLALNLSSNVSYLFEQAEFGAWTSKAALDWSFTETAKLSPFVALVVGIDDNNVNTSDNDNELVAGMMLSLSF